MSLQTKLLTSLRAEMDARALAIGNSLDRCVEAEALAETLKDAGIANPMALGYSQKAGDGAKVMCWVYLSGTEKACDLIEAVFAADLEVADVILGSLIHSTRIVTLFFRDLETGVEAHLPDAEALALVRAFKPEQPAPDLIGRSRLAEEVPA